MKRVLQALAILQVVLVAGLVFRIVTVLSTPMPHFGEIASLPAPTPLPPPRAAAKPSEAVTDAIVEHDLFDEQRGQNKPEDGESTVEAAPVPPPSTVKLMGVILLGAEPVAILLDTNVKPDQQAVHKGDMFGEYEVGEISARGVMLLGGVGQQFQIPLKVEAAAAIANTVPTSRAPGANPAGSAVRAPQPPGRPVVPKTPPGRYDAAADANAADQKAMSARERAQAIAQRNADLRKSNVKKATAGGTAGADGEQKGPDPVQARLEALRQLREAAKTR